MRKVGREPASVSRSPFPPTFLALTPQGAVQGFGAFLQRNRASRLKSWLSNPLPCDFGLCRVGTEHTSTDGDPAATNRTAAVGGMGSVGQPAAHSPPDRRREAAGAGSALASSLPAGTLPASSLPASSLPAGSLPAGSLSAGSLSGSSLSTSVRPAEVSQQLQGLIDNLNSVVLGKPEVVHLTIVTLLAGGHILLEDVPGVGKTLVGKALARSIEGSFVRLQLTPDLLPSDIVGTTLYDSAAGEFVYSQGPLFANVVLADEVNRTTPRTQSALLEAMSDGQVSVDGKTYTLPRPFMVIATQNPYEFEGTYPLPESQLDRFLLRMRVGYPNRDNELQILSRHRSGEPVDDLPPVLHAAEVLPLQEAVSQVRVDDSLAEYLLDLIEATRQSEELQVGASTRGSLAYYRAAQAAALIDGRDYVIPDDLKQLAIPVLAHRVIPRGYFHAGQREAVEAIIARLVEETPVPD